MPQIPPRWFFYLCVVTTLLSLFVVCLGAYTRLKDAGLGCPDWPGCYQQLTAPQSNAAISLAQSQYPDAQIEPQKAAIEMFHRYVAGTLGLLVIVTALAAMRMGFLTLPLVLMALIVCQALLGMWTVTLKLLPLTVLSHLIGGLSIVSCLWWLTLSARAAVPARALGLPPILLMLALVTVILQIILGGWTSANYAALSCLSFPACQLSQYFPHGFHAEAFMIFKGIGLSEPLSAFSEAERVTIHMTHRIGAIAVTLVVSLLAYQTYQKRPCLGLGLLCVLIAQITLGAFNVIHRLPLHNAVAHHAMAACLLLYLITLWHANTRGKHA